MLICNKKKKWAWPAIVIWETWGQISWFTYGSRSTDYFAFCNHLSKPPNTHALWVNMIPRAKLVNVMWLFDLSLFLQHKFTFFLIDDYMVNKIINNHNYDLKNKRNFLFIQETSNSSVTVATNNWNIVQHKIICD